MSQILSGRNAIQECILARRRSVETIFLQGKNGQPDDPKMAEWLKAQGKTFQLVDRKNLDTKTGGVRHQGVAARVSDYPYVHFEDVEADTREHLLVLICDSITDPQNLGAICRAAHCFGVDYLLLNKDHSAEISPTVVVASAGAAEHLKIIKVTNLVRTLEALKEKGFWSYAAHPRAETSLDALQSSQRRVVVMGSEHEGIRPLLLKNCDYPFSIPMKGAFDSLNVAQATAVVLYQLSKAMH